MDCCVSKTTIQTVHGSNLAVGSKSLFQLKKMYINLRTSLF